MYTVAESTPDKGTDPFPVRTPTDDDGELPVAGTLTGRPATIVWCCLCNPTFSRFSRTPTYGQEFGESSEMINKLFKKVQSEWLLSYSPHTRISVLPTASIVTVMSGGSRCNSDYFTYYFTRFTASQYIVSQNYYIPHTSLITSHFSLRTYRHTTNSHTGIYGSNPEPSARQHGHLGLQPNPVR